MSIGTIPLIVLVLMLIGAFPSWGYGRSWATPLPADWVSFCSLCSYRCWWGEFELPRGEQSRWLPVVG